MHWTQFQSHYMDNNNGSPQSRAQALIKPIFQACINEFEGLDNAGIIQSDFFVQFIQELFGRSKDGIITLFKQNDQNKEEISNLRTTIQQLRWQYEANTLQQSEQVEQLREVIFQLQQRKGEIQKEMGQTKKELAEVRRNAEENKGEKDQLQEQIEEMGIKIKELEQQKLLLEREYNREYDKRCKLKEQLTSTEQALNQLQKQFWEVEGNRQSLSKSLERNKEELQQLRDIVEESEYLSSLSPLSKQKHEEPFSQQQQKSFNSQNQRQTIEEDILIRLSQTHFPLHPSQQTLELPPKCQRPQTASQHKPIRKMPKSVQSHQKPKKQQSKQNLLSKPQNKQAVRSQLGSIFKDRLKYQSQHDQQHQQQVEKLKEKVKVKQEEKNKLMAEVAMLKALRTEPVLLPGPSREGLARFRAENQELRRIARELTMRKGAAQQKYEQERERCEYYKAQHRKIYEKLLLRQAESALLQQQLSLVEQENSSRIDQSEIFDNLSQRFNSLVRNHEVQQPSFRSGAEFDPRCYYSIQNSMQIDQAGDSLTVQNHKQIPIKLCESNDSPVKALPSEESKNMEQLFLQDIEEIAYQPQQQPEVQTERLLLSELMQNSRKQNSFTQCQFLPSDHLRNPLEIVSLGVLAQYLPVKANLNRFQCEGVVISPQKKILSLCSLEKYLVLPRNKSNNLELVTLQTVAFPKKIKQSKLQIIGQPKIAICPQKVIRNFQFISFDSFAFRPSIKIDYSVQFISSSNSQSIQTENYTSQASSNTNLMILCDKQAQINQQLSHFQVNTDCATSNEIECNTQRCQTLQIGVNSKEICLQHTEINTEASLNISTFMNTESILMSQAESQTNSLILVDASSEMFYNPMNDEGWNTDCIITKQMGVQNNSYDKLMIKSCIIEASVQPFPKKLNSIKLNDIIISGKVPYSKNNWCIINTFNEKIAEKLTIMVDFAVNTKNIQNICIETNTDVISTIDESTQYISLNSSLKTQKCIEMAITSIKNNEISLPVKSEHLKQTEQFKQIEETIKNTSFKLNITSSTLPNTKDQNYYIPINSQNMLMLSPRTGEYEQKSLNQINSSRTRDSSTQLRRQAKKSPSKIKKAKLKKRKQNEGSFCIQGQIDISLQSINSENPSSQQSFTKSQIISKPSATQQKTAAQTPCIQKEGINLQESLDASKWKIIRQYFYMLKQINLKSSNKLQKGNKQLNFKNWAHQLYILSGQKEGQKSDFVLWRGRLLRLSSKAPQLLQLKEQKRFLSGTGNLLLGNSEVVITNSLLQIKRSRKQRIFRGQMAEGEWKLLHASTYHFQ